MSLIELAACPFCGGYAEFERMGGARNSCIVACTDCGCRLETNESWPNSGKQWNIRIHAAAKPHPSDTRPERGEG